MWCLWTGNWSHSTKGCLDVVFTDVVSHKFRVTRASTSEHTVVQMSYMHLSAIIMRTQTWGRRGTQLRPPRVQHASDYCSRTRFLRPEGHRQWFKVFRLFSDHISINVQQLLKQNQQVSNILGNLNFSSGPCSTCTNPAGGVLCSVFYWASVWHNSGSEISNQDVTEVQKFQL